MKHVLLFLTAIFTLAVGYCSEGPRFDSGEKIYIQPNQIAISEHGIFIFLDNEWFPAEAIHANGSGIYATQLVDNRTKYNTWTCPHPDCRAINDWWNNKCYKCGR